MKAILNIPHRYRDGFSTIPLQMKMASRIAKISEDIQGGFESCWQFAINPVPTADNEAT